MRVLKIYCTSTRVVIIACLWDGDKSSDEIAISDLVQM